MKKRILTALWIIAMIFCFFYWMRGIGQRMLGMIDAPDPAYALFHPEAASHRGYGAYALGRIVISLLDWRFGLLAMTGFIGTIWLLHAHHKQKRKLERTDDELSLLKSKQSVLEGRISAQERDSQARRLATENTAHQLKSSLNSLSLRLELADVYPMAEEPIVHMNGQLDKFLKSSLVHHNDLQLNMEIVSLKELLEKEILPELAGYGASFVCSLNAGWLYGDKALLAQAMETLVSNACRHSVHVKLKVEEKEGSVEFAAANKTDSDHVPSFVRYETAEPGHYGIGLDLARTAARLHGGSLSVSVKSGWFMVSMRLPVHPWEMQDAKFQKGLSDSMMPEVKT